MGLLLGIDLGTTNCSVTAIESDGKPVVLRNREGDFLTPSVVYFNAEPGSTLIGRAAKELFAKSSDEWKKMGVEPDPTRLVMFVKREMGKTPQEVRFDEVERRPVPYEFWGRTLSPEEISAYILRKLKADAEFVLKKPVTDVVITCPAYFGSKEKNATKLAGEIAGFKVLEVLPEPTAAAMCFGIASQKSDETIFVFDLGGGTFDVTVLKVEENENGKNIRAIATDGNHKLGGKDWDDYLIAFVLSKFKAEFGIKLQHEKGADKDKALAKLRLDVEKAKIALSQNPQVPIKLEYGGAKLEMALTVKMFEDCTNDLVEECRSYCDNVLKDAGLTWDKIDSLVMVGSMSNSPPVRRALESWSGKKIKTDVVNMKTCVSEGAAIMGYKLTGGVTVQTLTKPLGFDDADADQETLDSIQVEQETGERISQAIGTAVNVVASSFGIVARNAQGTPVVDPIIRKNTPYPTSVVKTYPLTSDGMMSLDIKVVEGESRDPEECERLGTLSLALAGTLSKGDKIEVTLSIDKNGTLQAAALDKKNGLSVESVIRHEGALTSDQVDESKQYVGEQLSIG